YPPQRLPPYVCPKGNDTARTFGFDKKLAIKSQRVPNVAWKSDAKILVFVETVYSKLGKQILSVLDALKVTYKVETLSKNLPLLTTAKRGRFSMIVIENYYKYLNLPAWNRQLLDKYCLDYGVGIISFISSRTSVSYVQAKIKDSPLQFRQKQHAANLRFSPDSSVNFLAKPGAILETPQPDLDDWILFNVSEGFDSIISADDELGFERAAVIHDRGYFDGIERILFGHNFTHWINKISFVDSLRYMSGGSLQLDLKRYIEIDVDDIFVGQSGSRMTAADADALLESQNRLRHSVENFTYCLGFSGSFFRNGDSLEVKGDERLIEVGQNFIWFPHMWRHNHVHELNITQIKALMTLNKMFAQSWKIPVTSQYAISPQHAGVYPVHEDLFDAWREIWNISVTSTEEYPHFRPSSSRRGFIYKNISVLPRQTCGLYTHTHFFHSYPDGLSTLINNIEGGDLFLTILLNPFSIFMTHQQNFANDRLGIFTFERVIEFIKCWTNLRLYWMEPVRIAEAYFRRFPNERTPVWSNPCADARHEKILPKAFDCSAPMPLPNLLIVGPQKTGSTALSTYLSLHPNCTTNDPVPSSFEELQFFGGSNYARGILWYMDKFARKVKPEQHSVVFEKSATYFDNSEAPRAASTLLPKANVILLVVMGIDSGGLGTNRCLGPSKGRQYEPIDERTRTRLNELFLEDNIALHKLLIRNDLPIPEWLRSQLSKPRTNDHDYP
ncbi:unnamed protein product, partial [Anisakis simplex]|uniref:[heparan sulfate]-glucosamine N-sulfotransferase n=1 Tax=Anisakis simplex TaxID=6269 RepID=A0A0M3JV09_ANISI